MQDSWAAPAQVGPSEKALQAMGLLSTASVVDQHQYWRLITSIFMCSGASATGLTSAGSPLR